MAKVMVTDTHLTNIANAIRSKNNTSTTYKPSQMATAINNISTGVGINGKIKQCQVAAGETISAGDFVELIVDVTTSPITEQTLNSTDGLSSAERSILLQDGRVLLFFRKNGNLYCMLVTINGTTMTVNSTTQLTSSGNIKSLTKPLLLNDGRVFIGCDRNTNIAGSTYNWSLTGELITINGNLVAATSTALAVQSSGIGSEYNCYGQLALMPSGKIFVTYSNLNSSSSTTVYIYGRLVTINGNNVAAGNVINLDSVTGTAGGGIRCGLVVLNNTDLLVVKRYNNSTKYLNGVIVRISSSNELSVIANSYICNSVAVNACEVAKIDDEECFVGIVRSDGLFFKKIAIKNNTFSVSKDSNLTLKSQTDCYYGFSGLVLLDKRIRLIGSDQNGDCYVLKFPGYDVSASKINLTASTAANLPVNALVLSDGRIFGCSKSGTSGTAGVILNTPTTVKRSSSTSLMHGVAITSGSANSSINVYVPN